jgi:hypothetical protein
VLVVQQYIVAYNLARVRQRDWVGLQHSMSVATEWQARFESFTWLHLIRTHKELQSSVVENSI